MITLKILLSVLLGVAALYTIFGYPSQYGALTPRSRLYRTAGMFLLDLLLALLLLLTFTDFGEGKLGKARAIAYTVACLCLVLVWLGTALLDSLESYSYLRRQRRKNLQTMLEEEIEAAQKQATEKMLPTAGNEAMRQAAERAEKSRARVEAQIKDLAEAEKEIDDENNPPGPHAHA